MNNLIAPYGGQLTDLMAPADRAQELRKEAIDLASIDLNQRQLADLELLMSGAYSPVSMFMNQAEYERVLERMELADGTFWPYPITLDVSGSVAERLASGTRVALRDPEGFMVAVMEVQDVWRPDKQKEAEALFSSVDERHPGVHTLMNQRGGYYVGGRIEGLSLPLHHDYVSLRLTPQRLREALANRGWRRVIAYQARQPIHRAQYEFILHAALAYEANLLVHPMTGNSSADHLDHFSLIRSLQVALPRFPAATTALALSPLYARCAGMRETLLKAIVQRNYGCTHLVVGGEHDDAGRCRRGMDIFQEEAMPKLRDQIEAIGVDFIPFPRMVYVEDRAQFMPEEEVPAGARTVSLPGEEFSRRLAEGLKIPEWFSFREVIEELRKSYPPRSRQGFTVFFTGLSGAGKSTLAKVLTTKLLEMGGRQVTLLDGDIVRKHLSSELGFSREHRDINVRRIGYVASEITKNRGIAICAPIAPYRATRRDVRAMIEAHGGFIEVHVATPLEICEQRDRKGLYAKARAGIVKEFTGISDPYEAPENAELVIDTSQASVDAAVQRILLKLEQEGYLR